jgi:hypothetical protein
MEAQFAGLVRIKSRNPFTIELRSSEIELGTRWVGNKKGKPGRGIAAL